MNNALISFVWFYPDFVLISYAALTKFAWLLSACFLICKMTLPSQAPVQITWRLHRKLLDSAQDTGGAVLLHHDYVSSHIIFYELVYNKHYDGKLAGSNHREEMTGVSILWVLISIFIWGKDFGDKGAPLTINIDDPLALYFQQHGGWFQSWMVASSQQYGKALKTSAVNSCRPSIPCYHSYPRYPVPPTSLRLQNPSLRFGQPWSCLPCTLCPHVPRLLYQY